MQSETEIAYLAGIIDGEGTITFESKRDATRGRTYVRPLVHVVNTDLRLLDWIQTRFGGYLMPQPIGKASERSKPCYRLTWGGPNARTLLAQITPYLVIKDRQAAVVQRYYDAGTRIGRLGLPEEIHTERAVLLSEMRVLNKKGSDSDAL